MARYFGMMLAVMIVASGARAEPVFSFDTTPGKLSNAVVPINCSIELRPDAESLALAGVEVIDIEVRGVREALPWTSIPDSHGNDGFSARGISFHG